MSTTPVSIATPLIEQSYGNRTFYPVRHTESADGIFTIVKRPLKSITFKDALNATAVFDFKEPPSV